MKKWIITAIGYLVLVGMGYWIYTAVATPEQEASHEGHSEEENSHGSHGEHDGEEDSNDSHEEHGSSGESEVEVHLEANSDTLVIHLTDKSGKPVEELEVNHEKLLHLIVVDEHLEQYFHLHPEQKGAGNFEMRKSLEAGSYKAFVDIKPTNLSYNVEPISFTIGEPAESHQHGSLKPDDSFTKTVDGIETQLEVSSFKINEPISLQFSFSEDVTLQPYLGAMGHVVILDEHGEKYIHVHPLNDEETIFETEFKEPGIYKLWGEFQIDGKVYTYPFVIEIK
jgi:hypothetical protein